jgi:uroporphyrin-III C-methyltransferase
MNQFRQHIGKVILAGAGPGDPELITVKAARYIGMADVILTDRLVSEKIIYEYASKNAEVIFVGKQNNKAASVSQESINGLLVEYALKGKLVVRLKGGDISIFSNVLDELQTLTDHQIPYEIIPGITAASGASAYCGIPLTARGYAVSTRFLTFYKKSTITDGYWKELAATDDTLVFYMSSETLNEVVGQLTYHKIDSDKLLAVIEQATTPMQKIHICSLYDFAEKMQDRLFRSPSLVIIGRVVALYEKFAWLKNDGTDQYYFKPVGENSELLNSI